MSFITSLGDWLRKVSRSFSDVSINGRNIVLTRHNGDTETIITQDTDTTYNNATQSADGLMSANDKTKLDGIATGAEVNQHAFSNIQVGPATVAADSKTDTLTLGPGAGVIISANTANDSVTIGCVEASQSVPGIMSTADKTKLDGITAGAEPNQNAFSNVKVGSTTVAADAKTDTLELVAGSNVTLTPDAANDKVTIAATDTVYTHPTTSGNKHIPSGGSSGQILRWSADGTAVWGADNDVWSGYTLDINTNNTTDTWVPVFRNSTIQHRVIPANAKFTDTVTTADTSGSGNAVTSVTASNGALTVKKDSTFSLSNHTHSYLPLSGGTMTGNIHFKNTQTAPSLAIDNTSTYFRAYFDSFENGGSIYLYGKNHSDANLAGGFSLFAHNGTTYKILRGLPDGRLSWDDHGLAPTPKTSSIGQWSRVWATTSYSLPSGGTWAYVIVALNSSNGIWGMWADVKAGGTSIANNSSIARIYGFAWRIA